MSSVLYSALTPDERQRMRQARALTPQERDRRDEMILSQIEVIEAEVQALRDILSDAEGGEDAPAYHAH